MDCVSNVLWWESYVHIFLEWRIRMVNVYYLYKENEEM